jgi:hypothetical protein
VSEFVCVGVFSAKQKQTVFDIDRYWKCLFSNSFFRR